MAMKTFYMLFLQLLFSGVLSFDFNFTYNGFHDANLSLNAGSYVTPEGILSITNDSSKILGQAFYPLPIQLKERRDIEINSSQLAFSTTFVFSIKPKYPGLGGHGFAFVLSNTKEPKDSLANQFLGLPYNSNIANLSTCFLAVEFDTIQNFEFGDINDNHVGIDFCSLTSNASQPAAYYLDDGTDNNVSLSLKDGGTIQAWIEYYYNSQEEMQLNVTISPLGVQKPKKPLISLPIDLSTIINEMMYVGFSASTGVLAEAHDILGWSFQIGGAAQELDPSQLPSFYQRAKRAISHSRGFIIGITSATLALLLLAVYGTIHVLRVKPINETLEDWEMEYGTRRFRYSDLFSATKGFMESSVIGTGGFGKVYRGVIPSSGLEVAIKKVAHDSRQGMREFVAEITSMGHLRHRNLVQLHGWCRRQDELLLVYDYVPNGSLDNLLYNTKLIVLTWEHRYKIVVGIAQGLLYLHEECNQLVVHRDVKPSNVLIDEDLNPKLGDFGLARIYEHGIYPPTTHIVGTLGYLAPELTKTGKATTATDVYGFGALMLEVVCGRRPIEPQKNVAEEVVLVDWVRELHFQGEISGAVHHSMVGKSNLYEVELMLNLGLLCTHPQPEYRPSMRRVVEVLLGDSELPTFPPDLYIDPHDHGAITEYDVSTPQNGNITSLDRATSSKSYSFSYIQTPKQASRLTF